MNSNFKNSTMRNVFWDKVYELAKENSDIIVMSADCGAPSLDKFRKDLSGQFIKTGIAEANTILAAAGLALGGKKVFIYAIAPFITLRIYEQIKVELAAMKIPVTIVGIGAGFSYDDSGPTHHTLEDISIMRVLPNMTINNISDSVMADAFVDISCKMKEPNYIRLDRKFLPEIYKKEDDFSQGLAVLRESKDFYIVATGNMVHSALAVAEDLKNQSIEAGVIDLYTFPINERLFLEKIADAKKIVTLEEHFLPGGMGSAVIEVLADNNRLLPIKRIGISHKYGYCYEYGGRERIQSLHGLDKESIIKTILGLWN